MVYNTVPRFSLCHVVQDKVALLPQFCLYQQPLTALIRTNGNIRGLVFGETIVNISQSAGDTVCFIADKKSAKILLQVFEDFKHMSGLKCNYEKTTVHWLGADKFDKDWKLPVFWQEENFNTLGITFDVDELEM